jgi:MerR family regulatory protein
VYGKVKAMLKIGELAERAGVPTKTIRYYEEIEVLAPARPHAVVQIAGSALDAREGHAFDEDPLGGKEQQYDGQHE